MARIIPKSGTQLPLFQPESKWRAPRLSDMHPWGSTGRISIDCETRDPQLKEMGIGVRRGGYIVGYSFAIEDGPKHYIPLRHAEGDNVEETEGFLRYLRDQVGQFRGTIVGANLSYDLDYMTEEGCDFSGVQWFRDIQVAEPLIDELQMSFSLSTLSKKYLGIDKQEAVLKEAANAWGFDPKKEMWRLPGRFVGEYGVGDVVQPLQILRRQEKVIEDENLQKIFDLESQLLPVLVRMRRRGVAIDFKHLERVEQKMMREELKASAIVKHLTGIDIGINNVWKAEAMAAPLRKVGHVVPLGNPHKTTGKQKDSITAEWLKDREKKGCKVAGAISRARKVNKVRTTFAASVRVHSVKGRIHCTFNQLRKQSDDGSGGSEGDEQEGAAFGRLSCVDPNLQQQPARDPELGPMWRACYIPDEGKLWAANDYSQQEPRWAVHYAELSPYRSSIGMPGAKEAGDAYRNDPNTDNHEMMAKMAGIKRKDAKEIYLGLSYGMGGAKLARKLGLPTKFIELKKRPGVMLEVAGDEAQELLNTFDRKVPFIKLMARLCQDRAEERGYIQTAGGRKCHFPAKPDGIIGFDWAHKAFNRLIQGSSADQTKAAVVELDRQGYFIQLQVHDEIDGSVKDAAEAEAMAQVMRGALSSLIPSKVDTELGASWGHSMGWKGWPE